MGLKDKAAKIDLSNIGLSSTKPVSSAPKTAIGMHADALFRDEKLATENAQLKETLKTFDGSQPTRKLDPTLVRPSQWANRSEESLLSSEFQSLKREIESAGGNIQPIKVRPIDGGKFEIVFGHRRHRACLELQIPVLATIESIDDAKLFTEMDRENRERQALRPYETGLMYARALDLELFPSSRKLAEALSVDLTYVGRAIKLARLPSEVLSAFQSPLALQFSWAADLSDALQKDPEGVLARARDIAALDTKPSAKEVFNRLLGQGGSTVLPPGDQTLKIKGKHGRVQVKASGLDASKLKALEQAIRQILG